MLGKTVMNSFCSHAEGIEVCKCGKIRRNPESVNMYSLACSVCYTCSG